MADQPGSDMTIPVVEETARVGKRRVERDRVVVHKSVLHRDETVSLPLCVERLQIDRVPIGRPVTDPPSTREEDGVLIIPVLEERLVVEKHLILVEEVRIRRLRTEQQADRTVRLRREDVEIAHPPVHETPEQES